MASEVGQRAVANGRGGLGLEAPLNRIDSAQPRTRGFQNGSMLPFCQPLRIRRITSRRWDEAGEAGSTKTMPPEFFNSLI
jgi:hypothetical protein